MPKLSEASALRVGTATPSAVYAGAVKVWPAGILRPSVKSVTRSANGGGAISVARPATGANLAVGDLMLVFINSRVSSNTIIAPPTGWTNVVSQRRQSNGTLYVHYRVLQSGDPNAWTFSTGNTTGSSQLAQLVVIKDALTSDPIDSASSGTKASQAFFAGSPLTPNTDKTLHLHAAIGAYSDGASRSATASSPTVAVESYSYFATGSSLTGIAQEPGQGAGVTIPATNWTFTDGSSNAYCQIAIKGAQS